MKIYDKLYCQHSKDMSQCNCVEKPEEACDNCGLVSENGVLTVELYEGSHGQFYCEECVDEANLLHSNWKDRHIDGD